MPRWIFALLAGLIALPAFAQKKPEDALASMTTPANLQVELFAAEPMLLNPTSIDVDHRGRVWVAEAVNYRRKNFNRPILREEGDRIQVLIDEKGEGKATKAVTFYQGKELYGPLSVCVIPSIVDKKETLRVLVAQSPDILEFTCKDSSNPVADGPPKKFLTGFQGFDHDHGVHGLHLGPDGKLYFTVGDSGVKDLQSSDGKGKKYTSNTTDIQKGTVWRCDLDGKNLDLIAHNFRNNYEACVDSFGEIWCSDNDDDGNQQTRICFVMPGGNYGYGPRGPGQSHWHEEQPGIVHKVLRTGFGSPTGIQFYEGNLLGKKYENTLLHCDAGPREVRAFTRKPKGAGYELDQEIILTSSDTWFRPSDVCTAPDGSVFVSDWYDPGVGGHGMGDWTRGRIYRITPKGHKGYKVPEVKLDLKDDSIIDDVLCSPCLATRSLAIPIIQIMQKDLDIIGIAHALGENNIGAGRNLQQNIMIMRLLQCSKPAFHKALLKIMQTEPKKWIKGESRDQFSGLGMMFDRVVLKGIGETYPDLAQMPADQLKMYQPFAQSLSPRLSSEILFALRNTDANHVAELLPTLAKKYDGTDRTYLSALNIACGTDPERRDKILADFEKHFPEWNDKVADLVWELRPKSMLPKMEKLLVDPKLTAPQKARIVDILAGSETLDAGKSMLNLLGSDAPSEVKTRALENLKLFLPTKWAELKKSDAVRETISELFQAKQPLFGLMLASAAPECAKFEEIEATFRNTEFHPEVRREAVLTSGKLIRIESTKFLGSLVQDKVLGEVAIRAIGMHITGQATDPVSKEALAVLQGLLVSDAPVATKSFALAALAGNRTGTGWLLKLKEDGKFPESLVADAGRLLRNSPFQGERNKAMIAFPPPGKLDPKKLPPIATLAKKVGNAENGKQVMAKSLTGESQCLKCHMVRGTGGSIGPDLSMIGKKGSKENLYESIIEPSKAIADQYRSWRIDSDDGQSITGLLVQETETNLTLRDANGKDYTFNVKDVTKKKDAKSIMPEGLIATLTEDELIDLIEYMMTLQTPSLTPESWHVAGPFPDGGKGIDKDFVPEAKRFDIAAKFKSGGKEIGWQTLRSSSNTYFDLAAFHGNSSTNSVSYLALVIDSPSEQEVTLLVGTDDGCRLWVNGEKVLTHDRAEAAKPSRDSAKAKLKKGSNEILLKINNVANPHGFYFTLEGGVELKVK